MTSRAGEDFRFNVFSATLGFSRRHFFAYPKTRTADDLLACWLAVIKAAGGVPAEWLTDNMSSLVTLSGGRRIRSERAWRFAREAGFDLQLWEEGWPPWGARWDLSKVERVVFHKHKVS